MPTRTKRNAPSVTSAPMSSAPTVTPQVTIPQDLFANRQSPNQGTKKQNSPISMRTAPKKLSQHDPFYFGELFDPDGTYVPIQEKGWAGGTCHGGIGGCNCNGGGVSAGEGCWNDDSPWID